MTAAKPSQIRPTTSIPCEYEVMDCQGRVHVRFSDYLSALDFSNGFDAGWRHAMAEKRKRWREAKADWRARKGREKESAAARERRLAARRDSDEYRARDAAYRRRKRADKRGVGQHSEADDRAIRGVGRG